MGGRDRRDKEFRERDLGEIQELTDITSGKLIRRRFDGDKSSGF